MNTDFKLSIVIPLMNEEGSLSQLHQEITKVLSELDSSYEIIFVDDGSTDKSLEIISDLHVKDEHVEVIQFRRNFGKAAGLQAGFDIAKGDVIITMDADLQDDPKEIPRFLEKLEEGYDIVSGWKENRLDPVDKTLPSKLFNWATRKISGLELRDFNCGFKAYRREVFEYVSLYGELHRYIPVLAYWKGFKVAEIAVEHRAREHGGDNPEDRHRRRRVGAHHRRGAPDRADRPARRPEKERRPRAGRGRRREARRREHRHDRARGARPQLHDSRLRVTRRIAAPSSPVASSVAPTASASAFAAKSPTTRE